MCLGSSTAHPGAAPGGSRQGCSVTPRARRGEEPPEELRSLDLGRAAPGSPERGDRQDAGRRPALLDARCGQGARQAAHGAHRHRREPPGARPRCQAGRGPRARVRARRVSEPRTEQPSRLTVLAGPTAVGKGSVSADIRAHHPEIWISVSATTRSPRPGEQHGVHYWFVSDDEFDRMVEADELLEWAVVHGQRRYGTPRSPVVQALAAGRAALLEIDLQGARQVQVAMPEAFMVFLAPPSWEELVRRLVGRGTEEAEERERRLATARLELAAEAEFDVTIVNTRIHDAAEELVALMVARPGLS